MSLHTRLVKKVVASLFAVGVTLAAASSASAAVIYDFSLEANGEVGPIRVVLRFDDFLAAGSFAVFETTESPVLEYSTTNAIDPSSVVGVDIIAASTRIGISAVLPNAADHVLLNPNHPADFFVFDRTETQTGTFQSTAGLVVSSLNLDTRTPTATLTVTQVVPEPATLVLVGLAGIGVAARVRRRRL